VVSSTNKTDRHDITEILLKVALTTIKQTTYSFKSRSGLVSALMPSKKFYSNIMARTDDLLIFYG
jgi:hypothetical protein